MVGISQFVPRLIEWFGTRALLVTASLLVSASLLGFALLGDAGAYFLAVLIPLLVHAIGIALVFAPGSA
ncbi:hypothetical protein [Methylobacterium sp. CM6247]